jgi:hypothetical protein
MLEALRLSSHGIDLADAMHLCSRPHCMLAITEKRIFLNVAPPGNAWG